MRPLRLLTNNWAALLLAVSIGIIAFLIQEVTHLAIADPLLLAMLMGIVIRSIIPVDNQFTTGLSIAPVVFIPIGIPFYAVKNLNFVKVSRMQPSVIILIGCMILIYFAAILLLGKFLKQKREVTYLTATGSAICGASAIAITAPAVKAKSDDVSISLLSVSIAGLVSLFIILPFFASLFEMNNKEYAFFSGSILQFTGFVKSAMQDTSFLQADIPAKEAAALALSVKATRYVGLLIAITLFGSLIKKKLYFSWVLWIFLGAGIIGTLLFKFQDDFYTKQLVPSIKHIYNLSWAIAMAAIGLNADIRELFTNKGAKAIIMAFAGFIAAMVTFFIGISIISS